MGRVRDFVVDLAKNGKKAKEIKAMVDVAHGPSAMTIGQFFKIMAVISGRWGRCGQRCENPKKWDRTPEMIAAVSTFVEEDRCVMTKAIASEFELSHGTVENILHLDLGLVKKSARWVPNSRTKHQSIPTEYLLGHQGHQGDPPPGLITRSCTS